MNSIAQHLYEKQKTAKTIYFATKHREIVFFVYRANRKIVRLFFVLFLDFIDFNRNRDKNPAAHTAEAKREREKNAFIDSMVSIYRATCIRGKLFAYTRPNQIINKIYKLINGRLLFDFESVSEWGTLKEQNQQTDCIELK